MEHFKREFLDQHSKYEYKDLVAELNSITRTGFNLTNDRFCREILPIAARCALPAINELIVVHRGWLFDENSHSAGELRMLEAIKDAKLDDLPYQLGFTSNPGGFIICPLDLGRMPAAGFTRICEVGRVWDKLTVELNPSQIHFAQLAKVKSIVEQCDQDRKLINQAFCNLGIYHDQYYRGAPIFKDEIERRSK